MRTYKCERALLILQYDTWVFQRFGLKYSCMTGHWTIERVGIFFKEHRCMHAHIITNICTVSNMLDLNQLKANTNISWELLWSSISFFLNGPWGNALTGSSSNIFNKSTAKRGNIRLKGCIRKWEQNLGCWSPKDRNKKGNTFSKRRKGYILILW